MRNETSCGRRGLAFSERFALSVFLTTTALLSPANAETNARIETAVTPRCDVPARDFEQRLAQALGQSSAHRLDVFVAIEHDGAGYEVTLVTRDELSASREKTILAPSCDEAMDAAVVVLALATSQTADVEPSDSTALTAPATTAGPGVGPEPAPLRARVTRAPKDEGTARIESSSSSSASSRASLSTGIDAGTLPSPTLVVAGAFARSFSAFEVRALARYGLPSVNETTETGFYASERRDFGALELRACYGVGADVRLSACTGGELGAVRVTRRVEEAGSDVDEDAVTPRLSGVLAAFVRHQGGTVQPELEVSGSAVALGRAESASFLALRVAAGAAVEF
jgi:hypothetical protein